MRLSPDWGPDVLIYPVGGAVFRESSRGRCTLPLHVAWAITGVPRKRSTLESSVSPQAQIIIRLTDILMRSCIGLSDRRILGPVVSHSSTAG